MNPTGGFIGMGEARGFQSAPHLPPQPAAPEAPSHLADHNPAGVSFAGLVPAGLVPAGPVPAGLIPPSQVPAAPVSASLLRTLRQGIARGLNLEQLPALAIIVHRGMVVARNEQCCRLTGFGSSVDRPVPVEEVIVEGWPVAAPESPEAACAASQAQRPGRIRFECTLARRHGAPVEVSAVSETLVIAGEDCMLLLMLEQLHAPLAVLAELEGSFLEDVLDATPGAAAVTHNGRVLYVNPEFCRMFDYAQAGVAGEDLDSLVMPDGRLYETELIEHQLASSGRATLESQRRTRTGRTLEVSIVVSRLRLGGNARGLCITYQDIQQKKQEEARLRHTALHDGLTGLANRGLFLNRAELMLARLRRRPNRGFAVLFLDLDGFKQINDVMGHAAGDKVLLAIAERLRHIVRPQDTVARLGGDEFALLLDEAGDEADMRQVANRLHAEIARPIVVAHEDAYVSASIGIALASAPYLGATSESMLRDADQAMYAAKRAGKGSFRVCTLPGMTFA